MRQVDIHYVGPQRIWLIFFAFKQKHIWAQKRYIHSIDSTIN